MDRFNVVFRGEFLLGYDIDAAKDKLAGVFKLNERKLDALFAGEPITVTKGVNEIKGKQIVDAAAGCGVVFELEPAEDAVAPSAAPPPGSGGPTTAANSVTCPHCGTRQGRAASCLHCGAYLIEKETAARSAKVERVSVEVSSSAGAKTSSGGVFKSIRIFVLLLILLVVGLNTFLSGFHATSWDQTLWVGVYPINADGSEAVDQYIARLDEDTFLPIADYFSAEAERHALSLSDPVKMLLAPEVKSLPPIPPESGNPLAVMWWSLKMRVWVYRSDTFTESPSPEIKIFVLYHPRGEKERLENSLGIRKGMFGVVHAYADYGSQPKNHVIIAHEMLHTLGASDKYDPATELPRFPDGFADPERSPLYPQQLAEIMGSRIPQSEDQASMPPSLDFTVIGDKTAREIRWFK
ncbi:MAG: hypothetical protein QNI97_01355 [Desulfobacterales bacterium]|nr:hypothetical protein [Desulfobacterales bacterium]